MFQLACESEVSWGKVLNIYTIQMGKYRLLEGSNIQLIDATIKCKDPLIRKLFAPPSWDLVMGIKNGTITEEEYLEEYIKKLEYTSKVYLEEWFTVLDRGEIAISCFCSCDTFCHRFILAEFIYDVANEYGYDVNLIGEVVN